MEIKEKSIWTYTPASNNSHSPYLDHIKDIEQYNKPLPCKGYRQVEHNAFACESTVPNGIFTLDGHESHGDPEPPKGENPQFCYECLVLAFKSAENAVDFLKREVIQLRFQKEAKEGDHVITHLHEDIIENSLLRVDHVLTKEEFEEASDEYGSDKISTIVIPPEEEWVTINSIVS